MAADAHHTLQPSAAGATSVALHSQAWQAKYGHCQALCPALQVTPAQGTIYKAAESFKDLGLHPNLLRGLYDEMNFETPSKIQAQVLPLVLERSYKSLIAQVRISRHGKS